MNEMNVIDLHCDVLLKLYEGKGRLSFQDDSQLDVNLKRLKQGCVKVQCFAIFIEPEIKQANKFQVALDQVNYFYDEVLRKHPEMKLIRKWSDIHLLNKHEIGAVLTLEGVDAISDDLEKLKILYQLGVLSVGLTWNFANLAGDGCLEPRSAGLTSFGGKVIRLNNARNILTDVSHLSEQAFWDAIEIADYPVASHSNARAIFNHPRNLTNEQAKALFDRKAMIHVVFFPEFISEKKKVEIGDLIRHIDHFAELGGIQNIGLGSDFDGINAHVTNLENASTFPNLAEELLRYYSEVEVRGFFYNNFINTYGHIHE